MRTIQQYLNTANERRQRGDAGFSLVELIVVVVILGILAAVAIPIFNGIQQEAEQKAAEAAAANAASEAAVIVATGNGSTLPALMGKYAITFNPAAPSQVDQICATATHVDNGSITAKKGPAC